MPIARTRARALRTGFDPLTAILSGRSIGITYAPTAALMALRLAPAYSSVQPIAGGENSRMADTAVKTDPRSWDSWTKVRGAKYLPQLPEGDTGITATSSRQGFFVPQSARSSGPSRPHKSLVTPEASTLRCGALQVIPIHRGPTRSEAAQMQQLPGWAEFDPRGTSEGIEACDCGLARY
jgi:hypothetical protein